VSAPIEPGLDTDIAVAEAMGAIWTPVYGDDRYLIWPDTAAGPLAYRWPAGKIDRWEDLPAYSTSRTASDAIVDELTALGASVHISANPDETHVEMFGKGMLLWAEAVWVEGSPATALPLALCRARLHPDVVAWVDRQRAARAARGVTS